MGKVSDKVCAVSKDKQFYKLGADVEKARWYGVADEAREAMDPIVHGDLVEIEFKDEAGKRVIVSAKKTGESPVVKSESTSSDKFTCGKCGKAMKDDTYEFCYTCNQAEPKKSYGKSPEEQATIKRQAIGHMTSRSLIALQGHIDPNNITGIMETLYKKYIELVG